MREEISKHGGVIAATLFSILLVAGAYVLARGFEFPQLAQASSETALLQAIASKDSDTDGLPNWEESLYGTDPNVADTFHLGMTDGEAVAQGLIVPKAIADIRTSTSTAGAIVDPSLPPAPAEGTLTAAFAENFFTLFVAARTANGDSDLSEKQMSDIANQAVSQLTSSIKPTSDFKAAKDLVVSGSGPEAMKTFAEQAEAVLLKNTNDATTTELNYLQQAIEGGDKTAYAHIASIARGYRGSAAGIAALPVPKDLAADDLTLINTLMRMNEVISDFTKADSDPLAAILALQQYQTVITLLGKTFVSIDNTYAKAGVFLSPGTPGAGFANMVSNVQKNIEKTTKTAAASPSGN
jgi:hypothetical protein